MLARSAESTVGTGAATVCRRIHSNGGGEKAQRLAESIEEQDDDTNLIAFAMNLFDIVGINQDDRGEHLIVLTPSNHMLVPDFPGLPEDGCTVTFERDVALSRRRTVPDLGTPADSQRSGSHPLR